MNEWDMFVKISRVNCGTFIYLVLGIEFRTSWMPNRSYPKEQSLQYPVRRQGKRTGTWLAESCLVSPIVSENRKA